MAIPQKHLTGVCRPGSGELCCRYLANNGGEWSCEKLTPMRAFLDKRVAEGQMCAKGDNCEGMPDPDDETNQ